MEDLVWALDSLQLEVTTSQTAICPGPHQVSEGLCSQVQHAGVCTGTGILTHCERLERLLPMTFQALPGCIPISVIVTFLADYLATDQGMAVEDTAVQSVVSGTCLTFPHASARPPPLSPRCLA